MHLYTAAAVKRLRQMFNNSAPFSLYLKSLLPSAYIGDASDHPELLRKLIGVLHEDEDFDCAICYFPPTDAVITKCKHVFCKRCILRRTRNSCPICRGPLSISDLFSAPPQYIEEPGRFPVTIPSKVSTLIKLLKESRDVRSTSKSVVFTLFQKTLLGQDTVLLANVKVSGAGINLTAASEVYLPEPWCGTRHLRSGQYIDRVLQYGQTKNVRIVRLIVDNSIEERISAMQERKKQAIEASGRQGPEERREVSKEDLCSSLILE
ncbi:hypothetical protein OIU78_020003 [Salix suchowensis]|nr:hypothetical protein OIU78_020003 [Salix suchowensis]